VEAKRAVPRSEMAAKEANLNGSGNKMNTNMQSHTTSPGGMKFPLPGENCVHSTPMKSNSSTGNLFSPQSDGKEFDEYAYNKIFVGGLHYDTRDRKSFLFFYLLKSFHVCFCFFFSGISCVL
jgi:hypothetical protein